MANFYASYPITGGSGAVPTYANLAAFPSAVTAGNGALAIALDSNILYESNGAAWIVLANPSYAGAITALTGDVTAAGPGSVPATIAAGAVTNAKIQAAAGINVNKLEALTVSRAVASDASGFLRSSVTTATELSYVNGVTSALQSQLNAKAIGPGTSIDSEIVLFNGTDGETLKRATGTGVVHATSGVYSASAVDLGTEVTGLLLVNRGGTGSNTALNNNRVMISAGGTIVEGASITANKAVASTASGLLTASATTDTELGYLSGVTSALQSQLNAKASSTLTSTHLFVGNGSNVATDVAASGDLTLANTGAFTVAKIQSTTVSGTTGSTNVVFSNAPTLVGPVLGTPLSATLTNATGLPLTTGVTGTLGITNGGTGQTTANPAFNALAPTTTKGDLIAYSTVNARLPVGSNAQVLTADSAQTLGVKWATASVAQATPSVLGSVTSFFPVIKSAVNEVTNANYAILDTDGYQQILMITGNSDRTVTLPNPANNAGRTITIKKIDSGTGIVTLGGFSGDTIDGLSTFPLTFRYQSVTVVTDNANWYITDYPNKYYNTYYSATPVATTGLRAENTVAVPYTAIYSVTVTASFNSGNTVANRSDLVVDIRTGSTGVAAGTIQASSEANVSASASGNSQGTPVAAWIGSVTAGNSIYFGSTLSNSNGTGGVNTFIMTVDEVRRV